MATVDPTYIGDLFRYRKGLRKHVAARLSDDPASPSFLLDDGTVSKEALDAGKEPDAGLMEAHLGQQATSAPSRLIRLATSAAAGALPLDPDILVATALAMISDVATARLVATELVNMGRADLLGRLPLSASEQAWLVFVAAAGSMDIASLTWALGQLPTDRYRPKYSVIVSVLDDAKKSREFLTAVEPHLGLFPDDPAASFLRSRIHPAALETGELSKIARAFAQSLPLTENMRAYVRLCTSDQTSAAYTGELAGSKGRLAVALAHPDIAAGSITSEDLDGVPIEIVDDLIDHQLVDFGKLQRWAGTAHFEYLTARTAPDRLDVSALRRLEHSDELNRRLFLNRDRAIDKQTSSASGAHFASLLALLQGRVQAVDLDSIFESDRRNAAKLLELATAPKSHEQILQILDAQLLADRSVWAPLLSIIGFDHLPVTDELRTSFSDFAEWLSLVQAREFLYVGQWNEAATSARQCLFLAKREQVRDEALNLLACALYQSGNATGALAALESAMEGDYNVSLLANLGVVAAGLEPEIAASHLSRLATEGPTLEMRANAIQRAVMMWKGADRLWAGQSEFGKLPDTLAGPIKHLIVANISLEAFKVLIEVLANSDPEYLTRPGALTGSPHMGTWEAAYYSARAVSDGFQSVIAVLGQVTDWDAVPAWLVDERDKLVEQTKDFLINNIDEPDNQAGVVALELSDRVTGLALRDQVFLALLGVATFTYHLTTSEIEISSDLIQVLDGARRKIDGLADEDVEIARDLEELSIRRVAINVHSKRIDELNAGVHQYNAALQALRSSAVGTPNWYAAQQVVRDQVELMMKVQRDLNGWLQFVTSDEVKASLIETIELARSNEMNARNAL